MERCTATISCAEPHQVGMFGERLLNGAPQARKQKEHLISASKQRWSMKHEAGSELLRLSRLRCLWECLEAEFRFLKNTDVENLGSCRVKAGAEQNFWESMFWTKIPKPHLETGTFMDVAVTFSVLSLPFCKMKIEALSSLTGMPKKCTKQNLWGDEPYRKSASLWKGNYNSELDFAKSVLSQQRSPRKRTFSLWISEASHVAQGCVSWTQVSLH